MRVTKYIVYIKDGERRTEFAKDSEQLQAHIDCCKELGYEIVEIVDK